MNSIENRWDFQRSDPSRLPVEAIEESHTATCRLLMRLACGIRRLAHGKPFPVSQFTVEDDGDDTNETELLGRRMESEDLQWLMNSFAAFLPLYFPPDSHRYELNGIVRSSCHSCVATLFFIVHSASHWLKECGDIDEATDEAVRGLLISVPIPKEVLYQGIDWLRVKEQLIYEAAVMRQYAADDSTAIYEHGKIDVDPANDWTVENIALKYGKSNETVRRWCREKRPPCQNAYPLPGNHWRVPARDID